MRTASILALLTMIALIVCAPVCQAVAVARAEILPIDDKDLAKMDKEEAKRAREQKIMEDEISNTGDDSQCGTVSIGNTASTNQRGLNGVAPGDTTVIVTGNVYNTASCGR